MADARSSLNAIVERQKRENARHARELDQRVKDARKFIESIPDALRKLDPDMRKIVLFGSLAFGDVRRQGFDIDLAVDSDRYLRIVDWSLSQRWKVDAIDLSAIDSQFADEIGRRGRVLYEADRR